MINRMTGYTKLFGSIIASTIWRADNETRIVWITMLAMASKHGVVEASVPGLADMARLPVDETRRAISVLESPDADSRTKDHEGKRILPVDGGWLIVNHAKYRAKMNAEERKEYLRIKQAEGRAKKKSTDVNRCQQKSTESTHAEAAPEADPSTPLPPKGGELASTVKGSTVIPSQLNLPEFKEAWEKWLSHLRQRRKFPSIEAQDLQLHRLSGMGLKEAVATIHHSIEHNWQGLYQKNANHAGTRHSLVDRNAGTANAKRIGQYDGIGKVV